MYVMKDLNLYQLTYGDRDENRPGGRNMVTHRGSFWYEDRKWHGEHDEIGLRADIPHTQTEYCALSFES